MRSGVTPAHSRPHPSPALDPLFVTGPFEVGRRHPIRVVAQDFPTEYSAGEYLALATLGLPIAVGALSVSIPWRVTTPYGEPSASGFTTFEVELAIIPGRGVWQLEPVFDDWIEPPARAKVARDALAKALGREARTLPLSMAYLPVLGRVVGDLPRSIAVGDTYLPTMFADPIGALRPSASPEAVDELIAQMLEVGTWLDGKRDDRVELVLDTVPAWLAGLLPEYDEE